MYFLLDPIIITIAIGSCREYSNRSHILSHWCLLVTITIVCQVLRPKHKLSQFARQTVSLPTVSHKVIVTVLLLVHVPVHAHRDLYLDLLHLSVLVEPLHLDGHHLLPPLLFWHPPCHHRRLVGAHWEDAGAGLAAGQRARLGVEAGAAGAHRPRLGQARPQTVETCQPASSQGLCPRLWCVAVFVLWIGLKLSWLRDHWRGGNHRGLPRQRWLARSCRLKSSGCGGVGQLCRCLYVRHSSYLFSHRLRLLKVISLRFPENVRYKSSSRTELVIDDWPDVWHGADQHAEAGLGHDAPGADHPGQAHARVQAEADEEHVGKTGDWIRGEMAVRTRGGLGDQEPCPSSCSKMDFVLFLSRVGQCGLKQGFLYNGTEFYKLFTENGFNFSKHN